MRETGERPPFPQNPAPYLTDWLFEIGPTSGDNIIGWQEMEAWQRINGVTLLPFEARILRRLSSEYSAEKWAARENDRPMPFLDLSDVKTRRDVVAAKISALFGWR